jgi:hypothetical protein
VQDVRTWTESRRVGVVISLEETTKDQEEPVSTAPWKVME